MSWLDHVPINTRAYVYQAALVCEDCGQALADTLSQEGVEDNGDSGTFPQGPYSHGGGEADSANFCGRGRNCVNAVKIGSRKIGCPLGNPLTNEGAMAVRDSVRRDLMNTDKYSRLVGRLLYHVWGDYVSNEEMLGTLVMPRKLPDSLARKLKSYNSKNKALVKNVLVANAEHVYLVGLCGLDADLIRSTINDDGEFGELEIITMPTEATEQYDSYKLIASAVSDGAWD